MYMLLRMVSAVGLVPIIFLGLIDIGICQEPQDTIAAGKQEYMRSCALCHGDNDKEDGVYASKLLVKPSTLNLLQMQNDVNFSTRTIFQIIEGSNEIKHHKPSEMPVWGDRFDHGSVLYLDDRFTRTYVLGRIFELILYLEEIQTQ